MAAGFGKSTLALERLIGPALDGYPVAYFAPTYRMLGEFWRLAVETLRPVITRQNASDHRLDLITGGVLEMWSLDVANTARGRKYRRLALDEAALVPDLLESFNLVLRPTLADFTGDADFYSTPRGYNDFYTLWARGGDPAYPDWTAWQRPTSDNPYIPPSEIEAMRHELTGLQYEQEILARFVALNSGLFRREWFATVLDTRPAGGRWVRFWDLAVSLKTGSDYTVGALVGHLPDGRLCIADVIRGQWEWPDARKIITATAHTDGKGVTIGVEQTAFQLAAVQELQRDPALLGHTVRGVAPDKDKLARAQPWAVRAEAGQVVLVRGLWNGPFLAIVSDFPQGPKDDDVDAVSGAVALLSEPIPARPVAAGARVPLAGWRT